MVEIHTTAPDRWVVVVDGEEREVYLSREEALDATGPVPVVHTREVSMQIKTST